MTNNSVHQFSVPLPDGRQLNLQDYRNKVLLVVNIASECGFAPQLKELEELRELFEGDDFEILALPSNDFGGQEPLEGEAIAEYCVSRYSTGFRVADKIRVRGPYAHPLYKFLSDKKQNGVLSVTPRWNFHKYLIDRDGKVVDFFYPFTKPLSSRIKKKILNLLGK